VKVQGQNRVVGQIRAGVYIVPVTPVVGLAEVQVDSETAGVQRRGSESVSHISGVSWRCGTHGVGDRKIGDGDCSRRGIVHRLLVVVHQLHESVDAQRVQRPRLGSVHQLNVLEVGVDGPDSVPASFKLEGERLEDEDEIRGRRGGEGERDVEATVLAHGEGLGVQLVAARVVLQLRDREKFGVHAGLGDIVGEPQVGNDHGGDGSESTRVSPRNSHKRVENLGHRQFHAQVEHGRDRSLDLGEGA